MHLCVEIQSDDPKCRPWVLLHCRMIACHRTGTTCPLKTKRWLDLLSGSCGNFFWIPVRFQNAAKPKDSQQVDRVKALRLFLRSLGLIK